MLEDAADVPQRGLRQAAVAIAGEQIDAALGQRHMHMHATAVIADDRLGHEGDGLAIAVRHVLDDVFHGHQVVGFLHQRIELGANLALAGIGHLVVVHFHFDAYFFQRLAHFRTQIVQRIQWCHREVATLHHRPVAAVAAGVFAAGIPMRFFRINLEEGVAHFIGKAHRIENEEFRFWPEEALLGDAAGLQIRFGAMRHATRIARIGLHGGRIQHIASQHQGGVSGERIDEGGGRVGQQHHVGVLDTAPAANRAAIEHLAILEQAGIDDRFGEGDMVLHAAHVGKTQVHKFDLVVFDELFELFQRHGVLRQRMEGRKQGPDGSDISKGRAS